MASTVDKEQIRVVHFIQLLHEVFSTPNLIHAEIKEILLLFSSNSPWQSFPTASPWSLLKSHLQGSLSLIQLP